MGRSTWLFRTDLHGNNNLASRYPWHKNCTTTGSIKEQLPRTINNDGNGSAPN
jgi:hypothetical protein